MISAENERLFAAIEQRRGRALSAAEKNIDVHQLQTDLEDGKQALREAIEAAQLAAIRKWAKGGHRGKIRVRTTPAMEKVIAGLYEKGLKHGQAELARGGYREYAGRTAAAVRLQAMMRKLQAKLTTISFRLNKRSTELDLSTLSSKAIVDALAKIPGALDVAGRMVSGALYRGLGAAFDAASGAVDASPAEGGGGNGWEQTAVMDGGTCDPCVEHDGDTFDTWDEACEQMPDGGPFPECDGGDRCRCRLAPVPL